MERSPLQPPCQEQSPDLMLAPQARLQRAKETRQAAPRQDKSQPNCSGSLSVATTKSNLWMGEVNLMLPRQYPSWSKVKAHWTWNPCGDAAYCSGSFPMRARPPWLGPALLRDLDPATSANYLEDPTDMASRLRRFQLRPPLPR